MIEKRKIEGRWWIFGPKRAAHFGILRYDPDAGLKLQVKVPQTRSLQQVLAHPWHIRSPAVIVGRDKHNQIVTLFGCSRPRFRVSGGMASYTFTPLRALLGKRFSKWSDVSFDNVQIEYSLLHKWTARSSIALLQGDQVRFQRLHDRQFKLGKGTRLTIGAVVSSKHGSSKFTIRENHWVEFSFDVPVGIDRLTHDYAAVFRRFLTLLTGERVFLDSLSFDQSTVELLQPNPGGADANRQTVPQNMVASLPDLGAGAGAVMRRWFQYHKQLEPVLNLLFAVVFNRSLYTNHRFLFLAQALEVYHRTNPTFKGNVQPKAAFRKRISRLLASVPPKQRRWLKEKLQHANEKNLAQRLDEILSTAPSEVKRFIAKRNEFAAKVRHTRNYYTHYTAELREKGKAATDKELPLLTEQMRGLLLLCILRDLGIHGTPLAKVAQGISSLRYVSL